MLTIQHIHIQHDHNSKHKVFVTSFPFRVYKRNRVQKAGVDYIQNKHKALISVGRVRLLIEGKKLQKNGGKEGKEEERG